MMKTFIRLSLILVFVIVAFDSNSQSSYVFHHLDTKDGLSNGSVTAILKDSYGFLWLGAQGALNRYDGTSFKSYPISLENNSLWVNTISQLKEDADGNIWMENEDQSVIYKRDKDCFINDITGYLLRLGIKIYGDFKIYIDKHNNLWVLTQEYIYYYEIENEKLNQYTLHLNVDALNTIKLNDDGQYLYAIHNCESLWRLEIKSGHQDFFNLPENVIHELDANNKSHNKIYTDFNGVLWLFSNRNNKVFYSSDPTLSWNVLIVNDPSCSQSNVILDIQDDQKGHIWIGTDHGGLFVFDKGNKKLENILHRSGEISSVASNNIGCLYLDNNKTMWLGHSKKGVSYYHDSFDKFVNVDNTQCKDVSVILEDRAGYIWIGTDGNGLYRSKKAKPEKISKMPVYSNAVVALAEDSKGRIWIGTYLNGLYCYQDGKYIHYTKENSKLASNDIWCITEDRFGNLWISALDGGIQCLRNGVDNLDSLSTVSENFGYTINMYYDGGDELYLATAYGLGIIDIVSGDRNLYFSNHKKTQNFKQTTITNVHKDSEDRIWLGHFQGLTIWDTKNDTLYFFDKKDGLCDNIIQGLFEDNNHNIWVTTSNGFSVLSVETRANGTLHFNSRNLSAKDGLSDNCFNHNAFCKLRNGDILLGRTEGYTIVNPNKTVKNNQRPLQVFFTDLSVGGENIQVDSVYNNHVLLQKPMEMVDSLVFKYDDRLITFQFASGELLTANKIKYTYQFDDYSSNWIPVNENRIEFSSLPPGKHTLLIKASASDGVWNNTPTALFLVVKSPFYLSVVAIVFYSCLFILLILLFVYRTKKQHSNKLEKQKVHFEREQDIKLNEMKLRFFTNVSHDLRTPLTLILSPIQSLLNDEMSEKMRKKLVTVNKNAEHLLQLINSLLDFRKLDMKAEILHLQSGDFVRFLTELSLSFQPYATERNITYLFRTKIDKRIIQFDSKKVRKMLLNLLSNAFKYTPDGGGVVIDLFKENDMMCFSVSDTGVGIADAEKEHVFERFYQATPKQEGSGSGIGLHIVDEYVKIHKGTISVYDNIPKGSVFVIKLPIIEDCFFNEQGGGQNNNIKHHSDASNIEDDNAPIFPVMPTLLFVDDNADLCEFAADELATEFNMLIAHNGKEALDCIEKHNVNIVVSDVMMPVMDGLELCKLIKNNIKWSHIPVVLLTARIAEEHQISGLESGADDYLTKPFNFNLLKLRIHKLIEWAEKCHIAFSQKMDVSPADITITSLDEQLIQKAIKIVEDHLDNFEFSVEDLSIAVGLSRSYLYKKLMNVTGRGPAEFIRTIRLKRGRQLLEQSQLQIAEIAYTVGFNSPKRFSVNFKNEFGLTPSEYLKSLK